MDILLFIAGVAIGWGISHFYYARAKRDSDAAAKKQELMLTTLLIAEEKAGHVELARDKDANITGGRNISITVQPAHLAITSHAAGVSLKAMTEDGRENRGAG